MKEKRLLLVIIQPRMPEGAKKEHIQTKSASDAYRDGWENIFGAKKANDTHTVN